MRAILMQLAAMVLVPPSQVFFLLLRSCRPCISFGIDECSSPLMTGHSMNVISQLNSTLAVILFFIVLSTHLIHFTHASLNFFCASACCMLLRARTTTRIMKWMILIRAEQLWPTGERSSAHSSSTTPPYAAPLSFFATGLLLAAELTFAFKDWWNWECTNNNINTGT